MTPFHGLSWHKSYYGLSWHKSYYGLSWHKSAFLATSAYIYSFILMGKFMFTANKKAMQQMRLKPY